MIEKLILSYIDRMTIDDIDDFARKHGIVLNSDELNTEKSVEIKKEVAKRKRFTNLMDGYKINICNGTQGLQNYTFNNLKERNARRYRGYTHE